MPSGKAVGIELPYTGWSCWLPNSSYLYTGMPANTHTHTHTQACALTLRPQRSQQASQYTFSFHVVGNNWLGIIKCSAYLFFFLNKLMKCPFIHVCYCLCVAECTGPLCTDLQGFNQESVCSWQANHSPCFSPLPTKEIRRQNMIEPRASITMTSYSVIHTPMGGCCNQKMYIYICLNHLKLQPIFKW